MFVDFNILNQLGSPSINSNTLANRPAAGQTGRLFVSIDTFALYRDNGTGWDLIGGPGTGTVTGSGAAGQVTYWTGASTVSGNNNLFWDAANERLGIGTTTPGHKLQINGTGTLASLNGGSDTYLMFAGNGNDQYRIGYTDNSVDYRRFSIYDALGTKEVITIDKQSRFVGINYQYSSLTDQPQYTFDVDGDARITNQFLVDYNANLKQITTSSTPTGYTGIMANSLLNSIRFINGTTGILMDFIFPASTQNYTLPTNSGTIALTSDIPSLSGYVQGSGTTNQVPKFTASGTIGNSLISDNGTIVKCNYATFDKGFILDLANETFIYGNRLGYSSNIKIAGAIQTQSNNGNDDGLKIENQIVTLGDYANILNQQKFTIDQSTLKTYTSYNGNVTGLQLDFNTLLYEIGDINNAITNTVFRVEANGYISCQNAGGTDGFDLDFINRLYKFGNINNGYNGTQIEIDDGSKIIKTKSATDDRGINLDFTNKAYKFDDSPSGRYFGLDANNDTLIASQVLAIANSGTSGTYLKINVNGTPYVIELLNP